MLKFISYNDLFCSNDLKRIHLYCVRNRIDSPKYFVFEWYLKVPYSLQRYREWQTYQAPGCLSIFSAYSKDYKYIRSLVS